MRFMDRDEGRNMRSRGVRSDGGGIGTVPLADEEATSLSAITGGGILTSGKLAPTLHRPTRRFAATTWVWLAVVVTGLGFVLLAVAWGLVAAETEVYLQMPYLVSGGLVGIGVIILGVTLLNIASRQQDALARHHQIDQLVDGIDELKVLLSASRGGPSGSRK